MTLCKFLILHSRNFITSTLSSSYVNYFYENMYEWITCLATQGFGWSTFFFNCTLSIGRLLFQALYCMKVLLSITIFFFILCLIVMWHLCRVQYCYLSNKCWAWMRRRKCVSSRSFWFDWFLALGLLKICLDYEIFMTMELIQKQNLVRVHF